MAGADPGIFAIEGVHPKGALEIGREVQLAGSLKSL